MTKEKEGIEAIDNFIESISELNRAISELHNVVSQIDEKLLKALVNYKRFLQMLLPKQ